LHPRLKAYRLIKTTRFDKDRVRYGRVNRLKPKPVYILFKNPVRTSKRTPHFTITKINWLTLFKFKSAVTNAQKSVANRMPEDYINV
jgi:hypothetical protein